MKTTSFNLTDELPIEIAATRCRDEIKKSSKNGVLFFDSTSTKLLIKTLLNCHLLLKKSLSKNPFIRGTDRQCDNREWS